MKIMYNVNRKFLRLIAFALIFAVLWGCESTPQKGGTSDDKGVLPIDLLSDSQKSQFKSATSAMQAQEYSESEKILETLLAQQPKVPEIYINLALSYYQQQKYDDVNRTLDSLNKVSGDIAPALNLRGLMAVKNGQFQEAEEFYNRALKLNPNYVNALYNAALLQDVYLQDVKKAVNFYERYVSLNNEDVQTKDWLMQLKASLDSQ